MIAIVGIKYLMLSLYLLYHRVVDILRRQHASFIAAFIAQQSSISTF